MKKRVVTLGAMSLGVACLAIVALVFVQAQKRTYELPPVVSKVASIQVLETQFRDRDQDRPEPSAKIFLKNNSDKTIIAYTVESGNEKDVDGYGEVKISDEVGPVAGPKAEFAIEIPIGNFKTEMPLRIIAVVFDDGSSAGEDVAAVELKKLVEQAFERKGRRVNPE